MTNQVETNQEKVLAHLTWLSNGVTEAPMTTNRYGDWVQFTVGIGNDEVAYITMTKEGFDLLCDRNRLKRKYKSPIVA